MTASCIADSSCNYHAVDSYCIADGSCGHYADSGCERVVADGYCKMDSTCNYVPTDGYCNYDASCGHYVPILGDILVTADGGGAVGEPFTINANCPNADHLYVTITCSETGYSNGFQVSGDSYSGTFTPSAAGTYNIKLEARNTATAEEAGTEYKQTSINKAVVPDVVDYSQMITEAIQAGNYSSLQEYVTARDAKIDSDPVKYANEQTTANLLTSLGYTGVRAYLNSKGYTDEQIGYDGNVYLIVNGVKYTLNISGIALTKDFNYASPANIDNALANAQIPQGTGSSWVLKVDGNNNTNDVIVLQKLLVVSGLLDMPIDPNTGMHVPFGTYGELTRQAVLDFQASHELDQDGIVGPLTWNALQLPWDDATNEPDRSSSIYQDILNNNNIYPGEGTVNLNIDSWTDNDVYAAKTSLFLLGYKNITPDASKEDNFKKDLVDFMKGYGKKEEFLLSNQDKTKLLDWLSKAANGTIQPLSTYDTAVINAKKNLGKLGYNNLFLFDEYSDFWSTEYNNDLSDFIGKYELNDAYAAVNSDKITLYRWIQQAANGQAPDAAKTIQDLFDLSSESMVNQPLQISIVDNIIHIKAYIRFTGSANEIYPGTSMTYAQLAEEGIKSAWEKSCFNGSDYDFKHWIIGKTEVEIISQIPGQSYITNPDQKYMEMYMDSSDETWYEDLLGDIENLTGLDLIDHNGHFHGGQDNWSVNSEKKIEMYRLDGRNDSPASLDWFKRVAAHEFGHALGLGDAYPDANGGLTLVDNAEISSGSSGSIMWSNGQVFANDLEMVLEAFKTNQWQYMMDYNGHTKSSVIRLPQSFRQ